MIGTWQIIIIVLLLVLLFGRGKISDLMGDVAKGIKSFKSGMADDAASSQSAQTIEHQADEPVARSANRDENKVN